jgi:AraC-like DNA-binding protein
MVYDIAIADPVTIPAHHHRSGHIYIPQTAGVVELGTGEIQWSGDSVEIRPPGHLHSIIVTRPTRLTAICIEPGRYERFAALLGQSTGATVPVVALRGATRRLREAMNLDHPAAGTIASAAVLEIVGAAALYRTGPDGIGLPERAVTYMNEHLRESLSVDRIARALRVPQRKLARVFKRSTGETMVAHLLRLRTEQALHEIVSTTATLKDIAARCGFYDQPHMCREVKRLTGLTPAELRKSSPGRA